VPRKPDFTTFPVPHIAGQPGLRVGITQFAPNGSSWERCYFKGSYVGMFKTQSCYHQASERLPVTNKGIAP
jgi:hypothetical protein